jgi:hypothetical protein
MNDQIKHHPTWNSDIDEDHKFYNHNITILNEDIYLSTF